MKFKDNGWSRINISPLALNLVEAEIKRLGIAVGSLTQRFNALLERVILPAQAARLQPRLLRGLG
jgi:hypothetical protein